MSNSHQKKLLHTEFGQRVTVDRVSGVSELSKVNGEKLRDIGESYNLQKDSLEYVGSAAVHVYRSPILGQLVFITQAPLGNASEDLASKALEALKSDLKVEFGRKRTTKRSGW